MLYKSCMYLNMMQSQHAFKTSRNLVEVCFFYLHSKAISEVSLSSIAMTTEAIVFGLSVMGCREMLGRSCPVSYIKLQKSLRRKITE